MSASGWPAPPPASKRFLGKPLRLGQVAAQECFTCAVKEGEPPQARLSEVVSESARPPEVPLSRLELTVQGFVEPLEIRCPELERRIARLLRPRAELLDERAAELSGVGPGQGRHQVPQHVRERSGIAGIAGEGERLVDKRASPLVVRTQLQLQRLKRHEMRAAAGVCEPVELERALERREALFVHLSKEALDAAVVRERGPGGAVGITELEGEPRGFEQRLAKARLAGLAFGLAEADQNVAALRWVDLWLPALKLERLLKPANRLVRTEVFERALAGQARVGDRLGKVDGGLRPVVSELGNARSRLAGQQLPPGPHRYGGEAGRGGLCRGLRRGSG